MSEQPQPVDPAQPHREMVEADDTNSNGGLLDDVSITDSLVLAAARNVPTKTRSSEDTADKGEESPKTIVVATKTYDGPSSAAEAPSSTNARAA